MEADIIKTAYLREKMGIKERRLAQKEALKADIIAAAFALYKKEGSWQAVTMRKTAAAVNYSLPTIYEFFENKDDLLKAIQSEGYIILCNMLKTRLEDAHIESSQILTTMAQTYWDFAWEYPELYQMMNVHKNAFEDHKESITFIRATGIRSLKKILTTQNNLKQSEQELTDKIESCRGIIHGFISLALNESMPKQRAHMLMMQTLNEFIKITPQ